MSHFYGTLQGGRGEVTRGGTKKSGLEAWVASYSGAVRVKVYVDMQGRDRVRVEKRTWQGSGKEMAIYDGPID